MGEHSRCGDGCLPKTYARWLNLAILSANGIDGPILLEDLNDLNDLAIASKTLPASGLWVDEFRESISAQRTTDSINAMV